MVDAASVEPNEAEEAPDILTLMYSGNLGRKQGLGQIIELAQTLQQRGAPVRIVLRGEGAMRLELAQAIERRKLSNISLEPLAPRSEMWNSLLSADVHLVPQIAAGGDSAVPSKVFSIMAAARPFIATAAGGSSLYRLAAISGAFLCTPPDDANAFADAVGRLQCDCALRRRLAKSGRSYVMTYADTGAVMSRLTDFIFGA
jgi:colanic acid biosynthesis glycosyl transferase WcaI